MTTRHFCDICDIQLASTENYAVGQFKRTHYHRDKFTNYAVAIEVIPYAPNYKAPTHLCHDCFNRIVTEGSE